MIDLFRKFRRDDEGAIAIETAIVVPTLMLMALAGVDYGTMLARQVELQNAMAEASQIALAAAPTDAAARQAVKEVLQTSTGLNTDHVSILEKYRCGTTDAYVDDSDDCGADPYSRFIQIQIIEHYEPLWAVITDADDVDFKLIRMVQVG